MQCCIPSLYFFGFFQKKNSRLFKITFLAFRKMCRIHFLTSAVCKIPAGGRDRTLDRLDAVGAGEEASVFEQVSQG